MVLPLVRLVWAAPCLSWLDIQFIQTLVSRLRYATPIYPYLLHEPCMTYLPLRTAAQYISYGVKALEPLHNGRPLSTDLV